MALTDLTGTTWTLNDSLTSYAGGSYSTKTYSVNITTAEQLPDVLGDYSDSFVHLETGYDGGGEYNMVCFSTSSSGYPPTVVAYGNDTKTLPDTWNSRYEGTFTITGGTDATNSVLIAWLEENCTDSTPATPDVVVTYEGANIVELSEAGTKTLKTAGKYLTDDVVLAYSGGSGGGGGVETASVTLTAVNGMMMPSHIYYTDSSMAVQHVTTGEVRNIPMPVGSIIFCYGGAGPAMDENVGITALYVKVSGTTLYAAYEVTG